MDEAEALADKVGIIDHGRLIAEDTPRDFINKLSAGVFHIEGSGDTEAFISRLDELPFIQGTNRN